MQIFYLCGIVFYIKVKNNKLESMNNMRNIIHRVNKNALKSQLQMLALVYDNENNTLLLFLIIIYALVLITNY